MLTDTGKIGSLGMVVVVGSRAILTVGPDFLRMALRPPWDFDGQRKVTKANRDFYEPPLLLGCDEHRSSPPF